MKTKITSFLVFLCLCFGVNNSFAQHEHHEHHHNLQPHQINESEIPTYKRIKVVIKDQADLDYIAGLGIDLHCGSSLKRINGQDVLTLEVQERDYKIIKNKNLKAEVLIDDLSKFYEERNKAELRVG